MSEPCTDSMIEELAKVLCDPLSQEYRPVIGAMLNQLRASITEERESHALTQKMRRSLQLGIAELQQQLAAANADATRLREFVSHKCDCKIRLYPRDERCTCGLFAALQQQPAAQVAASKDRKLTGAGERAK